MKSCRGQVDAQGPSIKNADVERLDSQLRRITISSSGPPVKGCDRARHQLGDLLGGTPILRTPVPLTKTPNPMHEIGSSSLFQGPCVGSCEPGVVSLTSAQTQISAIPSWGVWGGGGGALRCKIGVGIMSNYSPLWSLCSYTYNNPPKTLF